MEKLETKEKLMQELADFLVEANQAGYASDNVESWHKEADGSQTITHERGDWKYHDNFFGGEPYGGREVIFYQGKPLFMMVYYGRVFGEGVAHKDVYAILQKALKDSSPEALFRGPKLLVEGDCRYENEWEGDIDNFSGEEKIFFGDQEIYQAKYAGGLVDQRREV